METPISCARACKPFSKPLLSSSGVLPPSQRRLPRNQHKTLTHSGVGRHARKCDATPITTKHDKMKRRKTMQNTNISNEYRNVPISILVESATNPRKRFDEKNLEELAASMRAQGILAP